MELLLLAEACAKPFEKKLRHIFRLVIGQTAQEHHEELVAAEAADDARRERNFQHLADRLQRFVPHFVPVSVIDRLEVVEVDGEDADRLVLAVFGNVLVEKASVGKAGQVVLVRHVENLLVVTVQKRDILRDARRADDVSFLVEHRRLVGLEIAHLAVVHHLLRAHHQLAGVDHLHVGFEADALALLVLLRLQAPNDAVALAAASLHRFPDGARQRAIDFQMQAAEIFVPREIGHHIDGRLPPVADQPRMVTPPDTLLQPIIIIS